MSSNCEVGLNRLSNEGISLNVKYHDDRLNDNGINKENIKVLEELLKEISKKLDHIKFRMENKL